MYKNKKSCLNFPQNFALIKLVEKKSLQAAQKLQENTPLTKKKNIDLIQNNFEQITAFTVKYEKSIENLTNTSEKGENAGKFYIF